MKGLVVGCGSIGKRHLGNLKELGFGEIHALEPDRERRSEIAETFGVPTYASFEEAFKYPFDFCFICTPTNLHVPNALECARAGSHVFIEKPLSHNLEGSDELIEALDEGGLISFSGFVMRYHQCFKKIKEIVDKGTLGRVLSLRAQWGLYLPDWHPGTDYTQSYSARKELGGGIILDSIHEIDYVTALLGFPEKIFSFADHSSRLRIDTEDNAEILFYYEDKSIAEIHLDYLQRVRRRTCEITLEEGTIHWNLVEKKLEVYFQARKTWEVFEEPSDADDTVYVDEASDFLRHIGLNKSPSIDAVWGRDILKLALACKESAQSGKVINWNEK